MGNKEKEISNNEETDKNQEKEKTDEKNTMESGGAPKPIAIPDNLDLSKLRRQVLVKEPRITKFKISWDRKEETQASDNTDTTSNNEGNITGEKRTADDSGLPPAKK